MDYATTLNIDQQGRIIIPAKVRKALQLHTGDVLMLEADTRNICLRKCDSHIPMDIRLDSFLDILHSNVPCRILLCNHSKFYSMQHDLMRMGDFESFLVKGQFNCVSDNRTYKKPFIPIVTEYALLLKKTDSFIIPFSIRQEGVFSVQNTDILALTWHHLIRMTMESIGGRGALKDLYDLLKEHPKAKKNPHYQERIRATLYEHPDEYIPVSKGYFRLSYPVT